MTVEYVLQMHKAGWSFSADSCGKCKAKVNAQFPMVGHPHGWHCQGCGHYNIQDMNHWFPHDHPNHGPTAADIHEAMEIVRKREADASEGR